jgi:hypothetical protein
LSEEGVANAIRVTTTQRIEKIESGEISPLDFTLIKWVINELGGDQTILEEVKVDLAILELLEDGLELGLIGLTLDDLYYLDLCRKRSALQALQRQRSSILSQV